MVDEGCERLAELSSILRAQVDLVHGAADPEPNRLIRRTAVKIVFKRDGHLLRHPGLPRLQSVTCTVQDQLPRRAIALPALSRLIKEPNQEPTATGTRPHRATASHHRRSQMPHQAMPSTL
jgi:hypothetical protein